MYCTHGDDVGFGAPSLTFETFLGHAREAQKRGREVMSDFRNPADLVHNHGLVADALAFAQDTADAAPFVQVEPLRQWVAAGLAELS